MADVRLVVCVNERLGPGKNSCAGRGSRELIKKLKQRFTQEQLDIPVEEQICLGRCEQGITMRIAPGGVFFTEVTDKDVDAVMCALKDFKNRNELYNG